MWIARVLVAALLLVGCAARGMAAEADVYAVTCTSSTGFPIFCAVSATNPMPVSGTFSPLPGSLFNVNLTQEASVTLGAPSAYGTSPGAVTVPGVNAAVTQSVLPTNAATAALQTTGNASLTTIAGNTTNDATIGATTDSPCTVPTTSAACTLSATLKALTNLANSAIAAGANIIGKVGIDQTAPGTTNGVAVVGVNGATALAGAGATGAGSQRNTVAQDTTTVAGSAPGTAGTPSTNVVTVQTPTSNMVRGANSATGTSATTLTGMGAPGAGVSNYIASAQCFRTDGGTTLIYATLNDSASTQIPVPAGGGAAIVFATPLKVAANTAATFTPSSGVTTMFCNAQGFTGP